jgi:predicted GNAT family acetyltransferase
MEIQHQHHLTNGEFFLKNEQQQKLAVMTYVMVNDSTMLIEHTIVDESLRRSGHRKKISGCRCAICKSKRLQNNSAMSVCKCSVQKNTGICGCLGEIKFYNSAIQ